MPKWIEMPSQYTKSLLKMSPDTAMLFAPFSEVTSWSWKSHDTYGHYGP